MRPRRCDKDMWVARLRAWERELATDEHRMAQYADRTIAVLREEIKAMWPDALDEHDAASNDGLSGPSGRSP